MDNNSSMYALCGYIYSDYIEQETVIAVSESRELLANHAATLNSPFANTQDERNNFISNSTMHTAIIDIKYIAAPSVLSDITDKDDSDEVDDSNEASNSIYSSFGPNSLKWYTGYYTVVERRSNGLTDCIILINKFWFLPNKKIEFLRNTSDYETWTMTNICIYHLRALNRYFNSFFGNTV